MPFGLPRTARCRTGRCPFLHGRRCGGSGSRTIGTGTWPSTISTAITTFACRGKNSRMHTFLRRRRRTLFLEAFEERPVPLGLQVHRAAPVQQPQRAGAPQVPARAVPRAASRLRPAARPSAAGCKMPARPLERPARQRMEGARARVAPWPPRARASPMPLGLWRRGSPASAPWCGSAARSPSACGAAGLGARSTRASPPRITGPTARPSTGFCRARRCGAPSRRTPRLGASTTAGTSATSTASTTASAPFSRGSSCSSTAGGKGGARRTRR
mmetsp:Transcript_33238/g.94530  ORF Transcript_33238/g.94530 Transcript_33238/m.94530 type:complete len:272 (-) Transcript_33238:34-849(-)